MKMQHRQAILQIGSLKQSKAVEHLGGRQAKL